MKRRPPWGIEYFDKFVYNFYRLFSILIVRARTAQLCLFRMLNYIFFFIFFFHFLFHEMIYNCYSPVSLLTCTHCAFSLLFFYFVFNLIWTSIFNSFDLVINYDLTKMYNCSIGVCVCVRVLSILSVRSSQERNSKWI